MPRPSFLIRTTLFTLIAITLMACARGKEFTIAEREDANNAGHYPNFAIKPKGATEQFTNQDSQYLVHSLMKDAKDVNKLAVSYEETSSGISNSQTDDAKREIENTIREIEKSSMQN